MASVLIVDDNEEVRTQLSFLLEDAGHKVSSCDDGSYVTDQVRLLRPDVVLMDLNMPEVDGFTALENLKHDEATRDIPVIMVTASGHRHLMDKARALGATDFVVKPWRDFEVEDRVELALKNKPSS
jgi:CheY-like chemotaxis protein